MTFESHPIFAFPSGREPGYTGAEGETPPNVYDLMDNPFARFHETDAHFNCYVIPGLAAAGKAVYVTNTYLARSIGDGDARKIPVLKWAAIDVDLPGHRPWVDRPFEDKAADPADREKFFRLIEDTEFGEALESAIVYTTLHGFRAVWPLQEDVPAQHARAFYDQFHDYLLGLDADGLLDADDDTDRFTLDPACKNFNRHFRLPFAARDVGASKPFQPTPNEKIYCNFLDGFDHVRPLDWAPPEDYDDYVQAHYVKDQVADSDAGIHDRLPQGRFFADEEKVRAALEAIPADVGYGDWTKIGMALKHEYGDPAFQLWDEWSSDGDKYDGPQALRDKWATFGLSGGVGSATISSVFWMANNHTDGDPWSWLPAGYDDDVDLSNPDTLSKAERLADYIGVDVEHAPDNLVLWTSDASFYVWNEQLGTYEGPYGSASVMQPCIEDKCPGLMDGRQWGERDNGTRYYKGPSALFTEVGAEVQETSMKLGDDGVHYDARTKKVTIGTAWIDPELEAVEHDDVQQWLEYLFGDRVEEGLDWLACYPEFERPMCALYIDGPPSIGKSMLATGISQLHPQATGPVDYSTATSDFNSEIAKCPLVNADEKVAVSKFDSEGAAQKIKRFLGNSNHTVNKKNVQKMKLEGSPRLVITANDDQAFTIRESVNHHTRKAIEKRIGYIKANEKAGEYLARLGGRDYTEQWVNGKAIAEHILHLHETRDVDTGDRFLVEGWASDFTAAYGVNHGVEGELLAILIRYLEQGRDANKIIARNGEYLVNANALASRWEAYSLSDSDAPNSTRLADAFKSVSLDNSSTTRRKNGSKPFRVWKIDLKALCRKAASDNLADVSWILDRLEVEGPAREELMELAADDDGVVNLVDDTDRPEKAGGVFAGMDGEAVAE